VKDHQKTVVIAINTAWNIYNFRRNLIRALQDRGFRVVALAPRDAYAPRLEAMGVEFHSIAMDNKGTNPIEELRLLMAYRRILQKLSPHLLLSYTAKPNIYGSLAAASLRIPVLANVSGLGTLFLREGFAPKAARILYRIALRFPRRVFFQNAEDLELFCRERLVSPDRTGLLPGSGVDTARFAPREVCNSFPQTTRFLFIARLVRDKGIYEYVEASRRLRKTKGLEAEFLILGPLYPGNPGAVGRERLREWEEEGVIRYLGSSDDVAGFIADSDCVVLPSYREGLSRVLLEAASMAKPLVTTDVPGCREVVEEGKNGFLCRAGDADSLARAMERFLGLGPEERKAMGMRGRKKVLERFDERIVIGRYLEAIAEIIGDPEISRNIFRGDGKAAEADRAERGREEGDTR
jgi:glycosyltransferase involved in cell wall biosynthesis